MITDADAVYAWLRDGRHDLYVTQSGEWCLSGGGGLVSPRAVAAVRKMPGVVPAYSNTADCLRVGKTIDIDATAARRKDRSIGKLDLVFTDGTTGNSARGA